MLNKIIKFFNQVFSCNIFLVRLKNTNNGHDIYIPACKISEKLAELNETPYLLQTDFNWIVSINKRYKICSYSEEYFSCFHEEFKDSFSNIFFKHLSKYSNAKNELLTERVRKIREFSESLQFEIR
tara:strand:+ start:192 stop:569 length:378 start_codon:yes stop_codon:yes gene_type:complete